MKYLAIVLILASCSPKAYQQIEGKPVKFKRSIDPKAGKWIIIGFMIGTGIVGPVLYEEIPTLHKK